MSPDYSAEWVRKAQADRLAAVRALADARRARGQADIACFHAQQCVEKYFKAILARHGQYIPHTHDLLALSRLAASFTSLAGASELRYLNRHAVGVRYPGFSASQRDAKRSVSIMTAVARAAQRALGPPSSDAPGRRRARKAG